MVEASGKTLPVVSQPVIVGLCRVQKAFTAKTPEELSVTVAQLVQAVAVDAEEREDGWTLVVNSDGDRGLVPTSYLEQTQVSRSEVSKLESKVIVGPCRVLEAFNAETPEELSVKANQLVEALVVDEAEREEGWTLVVVSNGGRGLVPTSYLEPAQVHHSQFFDSEDNEAMFEVLETFTAEDEVELSVEEGEHVKRIKGFESVHGWTFVQNSLGTTGLVPSDYLRPLPTSPKKLTQDGLTGEHQPERQCVGGATEEASTRLCLDSEAVQPQLLEPRKAEAEAESASLALSGCVVLTTFTSENEVELNVEGVEHVQGIKGLVTSDYLRPLPISSNQLTTDGVSGEHQPAQQFVAEDTEEASTRHCLDSDAVQPQPLEPCKAVAEAASASASASLALSGCVASGQELEVLERCSEQSKVLFTMLLSSIKVEAAAATASPAQPGCVVSGEELEVLERFSKENEGAELPENTKRLQEKGAELPDETTRLEEGSELQEETNTLEDEASRLADERMEAAAAHRYINGLIVHQIKAKHAERWTIQEEMLRLAAELKEQEQKEMEHQLLEKKEQERKALRMLQFGAIRVTILDGTILRGEDEVDNIDPFVSCRISSKEEPQFGTPLAEDAENPVWNYSFIIPEIQLVDNLIFELSEYDPDREVQTIKVFNLQCSELLSNDVLHKKLLFQKTDITSTQGDLQVQVEYISSAEDYAKKLKAEKEENERKAKEEEEAWLKAREAQRKAAEEAERLKLEELRKIALEEAQRKIQEEEIRLQRVEAEKKAKESIQMDIVNDEDGEFMCKAYLRLGVTVRELGQHIIRECKLSVMPRIYLNSKQLCLEDLLLEAGIQNEDELRVEISHAVITASKDCTARVWSAATGTCELILEGHSDAVCSACISPDCRYVVTSSEDHTARIWQVDTGKCFRILTGHRDAVNEASFSPDSKLVVTASEDGTAKVWVTKTGVCKLTLKGHTTALLWAAFSPDGRSVTTTSADGTLKIWNAKTGICDRTLVGQKPVYLASFTSNGKSFVTAGGDSSAKICNMLTGEIERLLVGHKDLVLSASYAPASCPVTS